MDPNPFPPPARGRRGRRGNNPFANNYINRLGANWRNHLDLEEQEEHREEALLKPYRAEPRIDHVQPEQGQNLHPVNALNDMGALQRMIREMMEPEARRGERPTYRKPYPSYIDQIPLSPSFKVPNFTLFNGEDPHASSVEHISRFKKHKMKCRIPMEERHFIQMAQVALKISLRKRFDGMLFGDLAELADKASKYEELLREEQQKRNSSKGTNYKSPSSSIHMALTKPPKDQKPPPLTGGFVPNKPTQNKVYSFNLTKVDALFDEMLLHKAIETPHRLPKPEELKGRHYCKWHNSWNHSTNSSVVFRDVIQEGITTGRLKLGKKPPSVTTDPFPQPQVNMAESAHTECFDRIGTSSRDKARQKDYLRPTQRSKRMIEHPKKEIPIKMPGNEKPLAATIEGRWYSVRKSGRPTLELTRTQKRWVQRQYCTFLQNKSDAQVFPETSSARKGKNPEVFPRAEQTSQPQKLVKAESSGKPSIHPTSSSVNQLKPSQAQDDQNGLLKAEEQEDWTEEYREEQMEYDGELDEETEAFGAELESLLQGDLGINMVFI
ncbi:unnamed protein product [Prunus armeniaca]